MKEQIIKQSETPYNIKTYQYIIDMCWTVQFGKGDARRESGNHVWAMYYKYDQFHNTSLRCFVLKHNDVDICEIYKGYIKNQKIKKIKSINVSTEQEVNAVNSMLQEFEMHTINGVFYNRVYLMWDKKNKEATLIREFI